MRPPDEEGSPEALASALGAVGADHEGCDATSDHNQTQSHSTSSHVVWPRARTLDHATPPASRALPPALARNIAKLLVLILRADQPGEVAAAVGALRRTLQAADLDAHQLAAAITGARGDADDLDDLDRVEACLERVDFFNDREINFLVIVRGRLRCGQQISSAQRAWLHGLFARVDGLDLRARP